ncbi:MAG: hypothetical protein U5P10_17835 [Spirochaetia bacterium]|nr:hypothetical protein [Spirochaetia bacterium]
MGAEPGNESTRFLSFPGGRDCSGNGPRLPGGAEQAGKRSRGEAIAAESPAPPEAVAAAGL